MSKLFLSICLLFITGVTFSQPVKVILSGQVREAGNKSPVAFVNLVLLSAKDSAFVAGTISGDNGRFQLTEIPAGNYFLMITHTGYQKRSAIINVGHLNTILDLGNYDLQPDSGTLKEVLVSGRRDPVSLKMDKKTFTVSDNISQAGGSVLEAMKNLPGVALAQDGKLQLRGSDKVMVLIDGKQTALTGFGAQSSLDNIPASAIDRIEIINNPSSKFDANGNAGIINIIFKKEKKEGFNGKLAIAGGLGALWIKKENLPGIRPQYQHTPKINPSVSLNYRKKNINLFFQGDNLYTHTLNKNEFADRFYDNGDTVKQQTKRNRNTNIITLRSGIDWQADKSNTFTLSGLFSSEKIIDRGDEPFYDNTLKKQNRLWQFLEDELKTTVTASAGWQHKFPQTGRLLNMGFNYTFHREDEKYFFTNIMPSFTGLDSFKLVSDEHVADLNVDYVQPLKQGRFEAGLKLRRRFIPVNMHFKPGVNSPLDVKAGGWADYGETIPAVYGTYIYENEHIELEAGLRVEYVKLQYDVNPDHPTYKSDGYRYTEPFPNLRFAYKISNNSRLTAFYNRRVDRPNEVDIRIFPKYDDAEIIKVGNPALRPQFTNSFELGYRINWYGGYLAASAFHKRMDATITRIGSVIPGSNIIYNIFQNAGKSFNTGLELMVSQDLSKRVTMNLNLTGYKNIIDSFSVLNKYPVENVFAAAREEMFSGNLKFNTILHLPKQVDGQITVIYALPDLIPQGKTYSRFSIDAGVKKGIQKGRGEVFVNATDIANTLRIKKEINGNGFRYVSNDYFETQVFRIGYSYKF